MSQSVGGKGHNSYCVKFDANGEWTILKNIHEGGRVGSRNRKRDWAYYRSGAILNVLGHIGS